MNRTTLGLRALPAWAALTALAALSVSAGAAGPVLGDAKGRTVSGNGAYVVQLADMPVSAYQGGIRGLQATKPKKGQKVDPNSPAVVSYLAHLAAQQDKALAGVGASKKLYSYGYVFNGFAAELTAAQAQKLAQLPGVLAVTKDEARKLDTSSTPTFLGLSGPEGVWTKSDTTGEGVIIGIVDGGVWPEHLSFSDRTGANGNASKDGKLSYQQMAGWNGKCVPGEAFAGSDCNQKLIGARYYNAGWGGNAGIDAQLPWEYNSPRDFGGHGTHTASTSGGNANVPATGAAAVFGSISGIAPRARIASYKVCWETGAGGSCFTTDSVAAIDQAVADGVDVINFSISGSSTNFRDPVEIAFLFAADAGVFVAASAGNSGPSTSTVAHPGPWLTTVAAGTHNRNGEGSALLGNGVSYAGASVATAVSAPLIDSTAAGLPGADPTQVALCYGADDDAAVLDPVKVAGKIVVCQRGITARTNKSLAVQRAGGVGMILFNSPDSSLNADFHFVPTVHVGLSSGLAIKAYAATAGATASIAKATIVFNVPAPLTAAFSSRGPLLAGNGDLLKPDLIAPGQDILAGVAPPGNNGKLFDLYSGTSMSSPHVAGLAALFKQKYPGWSPMAIKSALMTTGYDVLDPSVSTATRIFRQGAGHVNPAAAMNPGLVYDSGYNDWLNFICGTQPGSFCSAFTPIDPSNLNVASIAIGDMAGTQTVTRKVTNVSGGSLTVNASISGLAGIAAVVSPATLTLNPGQTASFTVSFTNASAAPGTYVGGQLTWAGSGVSVRSPIVLRPVALAAPLQVSGSYSVTFGYNGAFSASPRGLVAATLTPGTVSDDPTDGACSLTAPNAQLIPVAVQANTTYARFALFDADVNAGADLDLCVFNSAGTLVGSSGSGTSAEEVSLLNPAAGAYTAVVQGWGVVGSSPFRLHTWLLGNTAAGNMTVSAPTTAVVSQTGAITLTTNGLAPATKYLGSVAYGGTTGMPSPTIVRIDTP
ncbi:MAG: S8 family peptidase [Burkholderiales bacterium]|nr:S8 family peptidase [Burkholderiales bacterium]